MLKVKNKRPHRLMNPRTHLFAITVLALDDPLYTQAGEWRRTRGIHAERTRE